MRRELCCSPPGNVVQRGWDTSLYQRRPPQGADHLLSFFHHSELRARSPVPPPRSCCPPVVVTCCGFRPYVIVVVTCVNGRRPCPVIGGSVDGLSVQKRAPSPHAPALTMQLGAYASGTTHETASFTSKGGRGTPRMIPGVGDFRN